MRKKIFKAFIFFLSVALLPIGFGDWYTVAQKEIVINPETTQERAVAYIKSSGMHFTTIEKALEVAGQNTTKDQIFVIPGTNPIIKRDVTIGVNDELILPYDGEIFEDTARSTARGFADLNATQRNLYLKNTVTLNEGVKLTISSGATFTVGGILGHFNQTYVGHTVGDFVEVIMKSNAQIINNGYMKIFGYIKEDQGNNGSIIYNNSANGMDLPFVIYDFRGGGFSNAANDKKVLPFSIFDFPNVRPIIEVAYGSKLTGMITLSTSAGITKSTGIVIGAAGLFRQGSGSIIRLKHHGSSDIFTTRDAVRATSSEALLNRTTIDLEGIVSVASLAINIGININTSNFFLPFSYKFKLNIKSGANINIDNKMKFLKGAEVIVDEGAVVNINNEVVFYQVYFEETKTAAFFYPIFFENIPARSINNGTMNINSSFGGNIETTNPDSVVNTLAKFVNEIKSLEMIEGAGSLTISTQTWKEITGYAIGYFSDPTEPTPTISRFANGANVYDSQGTWWQGPMGAGATVEVIGALQERQSGSCLTYDTLITLADGSYKMAGEIRAGDLVKVFNHETGELDIAPITFNDDIDTDPEMFDVIYLEFSNNKTVKVVYEHGFFDLDLMKYVYIDNNNYQDYIGHRFVEIAGEEVSEVILNDAYIVTELTQIVSPVSYYHLNIITEDMLSMPGGIPGLFNIFEYDNDLSYNAQKKAADIEMYGLFTYEDFADLVPYEFYAAFPTAYLKVSIGKGLISEEFIAQLILRYLPIAESQ